MAVSSVNYPSPVTVNGYSCRNCSEVDLAAKNIDPKHPRSGPFDRDAAIDPSRQASDPVKVAAAKRAAEHATQQITGYSPSGLKTASIQPGEGFSLAA